MQAIERQCLFNDDVWSTDHRDCIPQVHYEEAIWRAGTRFRTVLKINTSGYVELLLAFSFSNVSLSLL